MPLLKEPVQILALEPKATPVAQFRGRDHAVPRPPPYRLDVDSQVLAASRTHDPVPVNVTNVD